MLQHRCGVTHEIPGWIEKAPQTLAYRCHIHQRWWNVFYLITVLDGFSRYIVHHELRESMTEVDIEIVIQAALEKHPDAKPRIISDNGPQYIAKDFKAFVRFSGLTHVTTSPYYPAKQRKARSILRYVEERMHSSKSATRLR
jgi:transposase InsO family protein